MITQLVNDIVLVTFLKKFMFKDRITTFEYEFLNALWRVTRVVLDWDELLLDVDADMNVHPDTCRDRLPQEPYCKASVRV
ncbi:hypothetical protein B0H14DRAFT_1041134 [Mycena olivaceomarginata]|nr:hypothetical protein B0H14DRAFT_1041134 [Mycena olivaceomarginata]